jgi:hypothetical protein
MVYDELAKKFTSTGGRHTKSSGFYEAHHTQKLRPQKNSILNTEICSKKFTN